MNQNDVPQPAVAQNATAPQLSADASFRCERPSNAKVPTLQHSLDNSASIRSFLGSLSTLRNSSDSFSSPLSETLQHRQNIRDLVVENATRSLDHQELTCPASRPAWAPTQTAPDMTLLRALELTMEVTDVPYAKEYAQQYFSILKEQRITDLSGFCQLTPEQCNALKIPYKLQNAVCTALRQSYCPPSPAQPTHKTPGGTFQSAFQPCFSPPALLPSSSPPYTLDPPPFSQNRVPQRVPPSLRSNCENEGQGNGKQPADASICGQFPRDVSPRNTAKNRDLTSLLSTWTTPQQQQQTRHFQHSDDAKRSSHMNGLTAFQRYQPEGRAVSQLSPVEPHRTKLPSSPGATTLQWCPQNRISGNKPSFRSSASQRQDTRNNQEQNKFRRGRRTEMYKFQEEACCFGCGRPLQQCHCREDAHTNIT